MKLMSCIKRFINRDQNVLDEMEHAGQTCLLFMVILPSPQIFQMCSCLSKGGGRLSLQGPTKNSIGKEIDLRESFTLSFWVSMPLRPAKMIALKIAYQEFDHLYDFIYFSKGKVHLNLLMVE